MKRAAFVAGFIVFITGALLPQESDLPELPGPYLGQKPLSGRQIYLFRARVSGQKDRYLLGLGKDHRRAAAEGINDRR